MSANTYNLIVHNLRDEKIFGYMLFENSLLVYSGAAYSPYEISNTINQTEIYYPIKSVFEYMLSQGYIFEWDYTKIEYDELYDSVSIYSSNLMDGSGITKIEELNILTNPNAYINAIPTISDLLKIPKGFLYQSIANGLSIHISHGSNTLNDISIFLGKKQTSEITINISDTPISYFYQLQLEKIDSMNKVKWIRYNNSKANEEMISRTIDVISILEKSEDKDLTRYVLTFDDLLIIDDYIFSYNILNEYMYSMTDMFNYVASNMHNIKIFDDEVVNMLNLKRL